MGSALEPFRRVIADSNSSHPGAFYSVRVHQGIFTRIAARNRGVPGFGETYSHEPQEQPLSEIDCRTVEGHSELNTEFNSTEVGLC